MSRSPLCIALGLGLVLTVALLACEPAPTEGNGHEPTRPFSYSALVGRTLSLGSPTIAGHVVTVGGMDSRRPAIPFTFDWGDREITDGWFPASHTYTDTTRNYTVRVTAHYSATETCEATAQVLFAADWSFRRDAGVGRHVFVPPSAPTLGTVMPGWDVPSLSGFADEELGAPRPSIEYVLDVAHHLEVGYCDGDVNWSGDERQLVLKDDQFGGGYSLWFARPPSFACHPGFMAGQPGFSSLFHELGHNVTLNCPASFFLGGKTDGAYNGLVSETLAQIFQHAVVYDILNRTDRWSLSDDLCEAIRASATAGFAMLEGEHRRYVAGGNHFRSFNDPATPDDEALDTFLTAAYVAVMEADARGDFARFAHGMMAPIRTFREEDRVRYQEPANDAFRATFIVAAVSHGSGRDMRPDFRELGFPVDDAIYQELMGRV